MKSLRTSLLFIILFCYSVYIKADADNSSFIFEPITSLQYFPTNEVRKLYQDRDGYIWIPTYNGMLRYDGYTIISYKMDKFQQQPFINSFVNVVAEDYDHNLWIGTHNGLYMLDKVTGEVDKMTTPSLSASNVEVIIPLAGGDIWVGGSKGLYRRKAGEEDFIHYGREQIDGRKGDLDIKSMIVDEQGFLWIGGWNQGLYRYDSTQDRFYVYPSITEKNSPHTIFQDSGGTIWVGTWGGGLVKLVNPYDMERFSYINYRHRAGETQSLLDNIIYTIAQDRNSGKLWIGSRSGLSILESGEGEGKFINITPGKSRYELPFNEVNSIICTREGLMWLGMLGGGVCVVNTDRFRFNYDGLDKVHQQYMTSSVRSIYRAENGKLWMGIMGFGLIEYNRNNRTFISYREHPVLKRMNHISTVNAIIPRRSTGEICFATWDDGVWFYHPEKGTVSTISAKNQLKMTDECVYSLLEDSHGNLWIGTRDGICLLDKEGRFMTLTECLDSGQPELVPSPILSIAEDSEGVIWAATEYQGVLRIDNTSKLKKIHYYTQQNGGLKTENATSLCIDSKNRIWVGTDGDGLNLYDRKKDCFVSMFNRQLYSGEVVSNILEDNDGTIWFTTNSEMLHLTTSPEGEIEDIRSYTVSDGLQDYFFNRNACFKAADNELLFGGYKGLNSFYPDKVHKQVAFSPVVITDIKIYNTSVRHLEPEERNRILQKTVDFADKILLSYQENNFSIDFSVLNYMNPSQNKYVYKLDGYNTDWIYTDAGHHFAYYNNLKSGTYTFHVKGANENGIWMPEERTLIITILPPPWLTWWAYCGYALLLLLLLWYVYRVVKNRIRLKQAVEMGKIERQKIEEINHAKLQFFTNITHELFTPLTIISASIDELKQLHPEDAKLYMILSNNTVRLMRLIQQILEFRKVENGKLRLKVSRGNYTRFLKKNIEAFQPLVKKKGLSFDFPSDKEEVSGYFDSDKLDKIIYNLLSNAAKYTDKGGIIQIKQQYDEETGWLSFSITNPGEPMDKEKIARLFERFYEGDYRKFHTIGTGIGLSLTKDLVTLHHGQIEVSSDVAHGNTFTVTIPLGRSAYKEDEIDETIPDVESPSLYNEDFVCSEDIQNEADITSSHSDEESVSGIEKPTLLLVEDNDELLTVMTKLLKSHYHIRTATQGKEAIEVLEHEEIDLVVSDVMMPVMDGIELCKYIKNKFETCHIPVILLTAKRSEEDQMLGYESGADSYVTKPLHLALLHSRIDNLLKRKKRAGVDFRKQLVFEAKELNYTSMDEAFIQKAIDCVYKHLDDCRFEPSQFVEEMGMSRTTVADKLKSLTGLTPSAFISNVRLNTACKLIEEKKKIRITDLAYAVGFNDAKYFSTCFRKKFGLSPSDYMAKYEG